jgi:hypothetical protein
MSTVENGIVMIRGAVDGYRIATIEKAVFKVPCMVGVENQLRVAGTPLARRRPTRGS